MHRPLETAERTTPVGKRPRLGQLLVARGWITGEQLIRAIQSQRAVGGRIGTCLLEMDVLSEDRLLDALANQLGTPSIRIEQLRTIDRGVLSTMPRAVAERCQAVPFEIADNVVSVATLNVSNLAYLDEIAFCTNKRVRPHIANEVRLFEALERFYGVACPQRYEHLLDRLNRARYLWDEDARKLLESSDSGQVVWTPPDEIFGGLDRSPAAVRAPATPVARVAGPATPALDSPGADAAPPAVDAPAPAAAEVPAPPTAEAAARTEAETAPGPPAAEPAEPPAADRLLTLRELERRLAQVSTPAALGALILRYLRQSFSRCLLLKVKKDQVIGWLGEGAGVDRERLEALVIGPDQPSAFSDLRQGGGLFLGPLPPMPAHRALAATWGEDWPAASLLVPIRVRQRLVAVLYGDRGDDGLDGLKVDQLQRLAAKTAIAFEVCILRRRIDPGSAD